MTKTVCSIEDCGRTAYARGWCRPHWGRAWRNGGDPLAGATARGARIAFYEEHRDEQPDGCKIWPYSKTKAGYGQVRLDGKNQYVHILACQNRWGPAPRPNMDAAHECHNRACWNGEHLRWKSRAENLADKVRDGTDSRGEKSPSAKLTEADVLAIRASATSTRDYPDLAAQYGVSRFLISLIVRRKRWTHI